LVDADGAEAILASGAVTVIDVRTPAEFADGHLPGAELIDISASDFVSRISALDRSATYFVYCRSANRSGQATALMADLGFESIYELEGGTVGWEASGRALATG
ncbi:MAG: rhodanese-like domain-containing protein, partial [Ilumatobacteraceae bacterium]